MASPFRFFRKHQKAFLVVAGVLAMFIFVFADLFTSLVGRPGGRSPNTVVTSWDGGKLTAREMNMLYQRRLFLNEFLSNLLQLGQYRVEAGGGTPTQPNVPNLLLNRNVNSNYVVTQCVSDRIFADQAKEAGMAISDDMINHYMYELGSRQVGDQDIGNILKSIRQFDERTSEEFLFQGLRELLLGKLYESSVNGSVVSVPPEQLWEDWLKINDRISLEAAVLPVENFVSEVPEPAEGQLISFFEQNKNRPNDSMVRMGGAIMPSPEPGFRIPRKVKLIYLLGDVTAWTQELLPTVTDEEIADYYERNKRSQFVKMASETVAVEAEDEESPSSDTEEESADDQESSVDSTEVDGTESDESDDQADVSAEAEPTSETQPEADGDESNTDLVVEEEETEDEVEYEPLEKVSDEIRNLLANDKAVLELKGLMESAYGDLTTVYNRYGGDLIEARSDELEPPPVPPRLANLSTMAKEKKLVSEETVPLSARELAETLVGRAVDSQTGKKTVTQAAFTDLRLYEPLLAQDLDGYWYLVLKTEDNPSRIPELEEVHEEVVAAWKRTEAAKLALAKGEELAKEAQESGKSLEAFFADSKYEITTTDLFSWINFGSTPIELQRGPRIGDAPPLSPVGNNFMIRAFELKPESVISLLNFDHSDAYVLKLATRERTEEELRAAFLSEANSSQAMRAMVNNRIQGAMQILQNQILQRVKLDRQSLQNYLRANSGE